MLKNEIVIVKNEIVADESKMDGNLIKGLINLKIYLTIIIIIIVNACF